MVAEPEKGNGDVVLPNMEYGMAYRVFSTMAWPRVKEIVQNLVAGGLIVQTSNALDFNNEEMRPYLDRFYRGSNGYEAVEKQKVIKLLWDATGTEFGGRHELYERNYSGSFERCSFTAHYSLQRKPIIFFICRFSRTMYGRI